MKLPDALKGVTQLAFDTAPLIYFIEKNPSYFPLMLYIMTLVDSGQIKGLATNIALTEVLVQPLRQNNMNLVKRYEAVLSNSRNFRLENVTNTVARRAALLRANYNLRMPDSLHIATAIETGSGAFLTNDFGIKRVSEIPILILDELELPT